ncbi:MAG TPA: hypothetical protein PK156_33700 [Polyangium sp.]|nr:hypothetical protein [Polyangium sp.]
MLIFQWLEVVKSKHVGKQIVLKLRHVRADGTTQPVDDFDMGADPQQQAQQIEERAQGEADVLGGTQTYAIVATIGTDAVSRHLFRVDGSSGNTEVGLSEPASQMGLLGQTMRHNEVITRMLVTSIATTTAAKDKELQRLTARCQMLELRDDERSLNAEKMRSKQHKREIETKESMHRMEMIQEVVHAGRIVVPWIANELVANKNGQKLLPGGGISPMEESFKALFESIRPEQFEQLSNILNPMQYMSVLMAWRKYCGNGNDEPKKGG